MAFVFRQTRRMNRSLFVLALCPIALLLGSSPGSFHPLADSLAVFRFHIGWFALLGAGILLWLGWRKSGLAAGALSLAAVGAIWWSYFPQSPATALPYTLYQKNLSFELNNADDLIEDIYKTKSDFVTLQEVTKYNLHILDALKKDYPSQALCKFATVGGVAVISRFPQTSAPPICKDRLNLVAIQLQTKEGPVWLVSIHLSWPFPYQQARHVKALVPFLEQLDGPVVLAGDFNMVPWSYTMTQIEMSTKTRRVGATNGTFNLLNVVTIPIDHVLAPTNCIGETSALDLLGSDHHGVLARFTLEQC